MRPGAPQLGWTQSRSLRKFVPDRCRMPRMKTGEPWADTCPFRRAGSDCRPEDHARGDGLVRALIDQDKAAGRAVAPILVEAERRCRPQNGAADFIEPETRRCLVAMQGIDVDAVAELLHDGAGGASGVFDRVLTGCP